MRSAGSKPGTERYAMGACREERQFLDLLQAAGGRLRPGRRHAVYVLPDGRKITLSRHPSDGSRAWKNALANLKRMLKA